VLSTADSALAARSTLVVRIEDEYTYFAAGKPLLANATLALLDAAGATVATATSDITGVASLANVRAGVYQLQVSAPGHLTFTGQSEVVAGPPVEITVFISRSTVTYTWTVTPTTLVDTYKITVDAGA
jgi:hypothetical protein